MQFGLWRVAAFVSSLIHLFLTIYYLLVDLDGDFNRKSRHFESSSWRIKVGLRSSKTKLMPSKARNVLIQRKRFSLIQKKTIFLSNICGFVMVTYCELRGFVVKVCKFCCTGSGYVKNISTFLVVICFSIFVWSVYKKILHMQENIAYAYILGLSWYLANH